MRQTTDRRLPCTVAAPSRTMRSRYQVAILRRGAVLRCDVVLLGRADAGLKVLVMQGQGSAATCESAVIEHGQRHLEQERPGWLLPQPAEEARTFLQCRLQRQHELIGALLVDDLHHRLVATGMKQDG